MLAQWGKGLPIHPWQKDISFPFAQWLPRLLPCVLQHWGEGWDLQMILHADCMSESARERWLTNSNTWNMFLFSHCWQACQQMVVFPEPATPSKKILTGLLIVLITKWNDVIENNFFSLTPHFDCSSALAWALVGQIWCFQAVAIHTSVRPIESQLCSSLWGTA